MKRSSWNLRQITIAVILVMTIIYSAGQLLGGDSSSGSREALSSKRAQDIIAGPLAPSELDCPPEQVEARAGPPKPGEAILSEARRLRARGWSNIDPFSGVSWLGGDDSEEGEEESPTGDVVLQATSYSPAGWRAVIEDRILAVGDELIGGRIAAISDGRVVVRGPGWEKVLRFSE
ncbi:MAG: hypothetical protein KAW17_04045 [Candidatus Eisenbacteria sp.]|nr:hypothetical protein [Candidatus Eisenbacteria bacterium]